MRGVWRTLLSAVVVAGGLACPGPGPGPDPNVFISFVSPSSVAQGRTKVITIRGEGVDWSGLTAAEVNFGAGVTVDDLTVVSATVVEATITAAGDATIGVRDVQVQNLTYDNPFQIVTPVLISEVTPLIPGSFFTLSLKGFDTDWLDGVTDIDLGPGLVHSGTVLSRQLRVEVPTADRVEVFGYVDLFAQPGTRSIVVNGETYEDTLTDVLTIDPVTPETITGSSLLQGTVDNALAPKVYEVTVPFGMKYSMSIQSVGLIDPVAVVFEAGGSGTAPAAVIRPFEPYDKLSIDPNDELRYVLVYDTELGGGTGYDFELTYQETDVGIDPTALTEGAYTLMQTLTATPPGDVNWYFLQSQLPWQLSTVELTTTAGGGGGGTLDAVLTILRDGPFEEDPADNTAEFPPYRLVTNDTGQQEAEFTQPVLLNETTRAVVTVQDLDNNSQGAGSEYGLLWNQIDLPGTRFQTFTQVPLEDPVAVAPLVGGVTQTTLDVTGLGNVDELRLAVDLFHRHTNELEIYLIHPSGTPKVQVKAAVMAEDDRGVIDAYSPDNSLGLGTVEVTDLNMFQGLPANGTWTLEIVDTVPSDAGVLRGWGLFITEQ